MKLLLVLTLLWLTACNDQVADSGTPPVPIPDSALNSHTLPPPDSVLHETIPTPHPQGIYQATLPCADCPGILHTVAFMPDLSFRLQEERWGTNPSVRQATGHWKPTQGVIWLYRDQLVVSRYRWKGDTLMYMQGFNETPLYKKPSALENKVWSNKEKAGVELFGLGNEPFWNVEIDEQKDIAFHLAEWEKPIRLPAVKPLVSPDSIHYAVSNDSVNLQVTVYPTFCSDGMSDFTYNHTVRLVYNRKIYRGCGILFRKPSAK